MKQIGIHLSLIAETELQTSVIQFFFIFIGYYDIAFFTFKVRRYSDLLLIKHNSYVAMGIISLDMLQFAVVLSN